MYATLKNGRQLRMPTDEEDAAITAAAMRDPDAMPLTDEEWARVQPFVRIGASLGSGAPVQAEAGLRLEPALLSRLRASGQGWQARVNALLHEAVVQGRI